MKRASIAVLFSSLGTIQNPPFPRVLMSLCIFSLVYEKLEYKSSNNNLTFYTFSIKSLHNYFTQTLKLIIFSYFFMMEVLAC